MKPLRFLAISALVLLLAQCRRGPIGPTPNPTPPDSILVICQVDTNIHSTYFTQGSSVADAIFYQVNLPAFSASGDLAGLRGKLPYLDSLGINTLWLSPIFLRGQLGSTANPYVIRDHYAIDPAVGTLADLRNLTADAHARGMRVLLTLPTKQIAQDHPWATVFPQLVLRDADLNFIAPEGAEWDGAVRVNHSDTVLPCGWSAVMKHWIRTANVDGFGLPNADEADPDYWAPIVADVRAEHPLAFMAAYGTDWGLFDAGFQFVMNIDMNAAMQRSFGFLGFGQYRDYYTTFLAGLPSDRQALAYVVNLETYAETHSPSDMFGNIDAAFLMRAFTHFCFGAPLMASGEEVGHRDLVPLIDPDPVVFDTSATYLAQYQQLNAMYASDSTIRMGEPEFFFDGDWVAVRKQGPKEVWFLGNRNWQSQTLNLPEDFAGKNWIDLKTGQSQWVGNYLQLNRYEYRIFVEP